MWLVFSIYPCEQLRKYACHASQIWLFACHSRVNIWEHEFYFSILSLSAVSRGVLPSFLIISKMSYSKSLNISLLEVITSSKNECVFIHNLSDLTLQISFNAWWVSINVDSKHPVACNHYRQPPSCRFDLHCGIGETGSPGIISIMCCQVHRNLTEYGTWSMVTQLLGKSHIP